MQPAIRGASEAASCCRTDRQLAARIFRVAGVLLALLIWWAFLALVLWEPKIGGRLPSAATVPSESDVKPPRFKYPAPDRPRSGTALHRTAALPIENATASGLQRRPVYASPESTANAGIQRSTRKDRAREIQMFLERAGCLSGSSGGQWNQSTQQGMTAFLKATNARLPVQYPDDVLLNHVRAHSGVRCTEMQSTASHDLAGRTEITPSGRRVSRPPGIMGVGGPRGHAAAPEDAPTMAGIRKPSLGERLKQSRVGPRSKTTIHAVRKGAAHGTVQRSVGNLLAHPLGTF